MPFVSKSQLRTCYGRRRKGWNCDEWVDKTPSVCCLPEKKGMPVKSRCMRKGERVFGKVQTGARGGRYFTITEKDNKGEICQVKVYISSRSK